jgi:protein-disulfide isomerase
MKSLLLCLALLFSTSFAYAGSPVVIEEFTDFECPFCARGSVTMDKLVQDYGGKVQLVIRNMPLKFHKNAMIAAQAYTAVSLQNQSAAYEFQKQVFAEQGRLESEGEGFLYAVAGKLGIDLPRMKADMKSAKVAEIIAKDQSDFANYGFQGTPSYVIGTEKVQGVRPYGTFKAIIDRQL